MKPNAVGDYKTAPEARGGVLLGSLRGLRRDFLGTLTKGFDEHGDIVRYRLASRVAHAVAHPDFAHEVLVSRSREFLKPKKGKGLGLLLGSGLVTNDEYDSWLSQRRMMQPIFHRQRIDALAGDMTAAGDELLSRWEELASSGRPVEMSGEMSRVTMEIITRTMFGEHAPGQAGRVSEALGVASLFVNDRLKNPLAVPLKIPTPANRAFLESNKTLDEIVYGIIRRRQASGEERGDLLDMLIAARDEETGEGMSETQIRDEVLTIFAAGHETTANALTWTWYLLARHPQIMKRLQREVDSVLAGRTPTAGDIPNLKYVAQIFNESLRLYPPVPMVARRVDQATHLGGYRLPKDSLVFMSIYHFHRHRDLWDGPETFDPDRWLPERGKRAHQLSFMPFGAGQRLCIGNHMALMEGALLLAQIARRYEPRLISSNPPVPEVGVTMTPKNGLPMLIQPRA
jgi:cytochrome P450